MRNNEKEPKLERLTVKIVKRNIPKFDKSTMTDFPYNKYNSKTLIEKINNYDLTEPFTIVDNIYCDAEFLLEEGTPLLNKPERKLIKCPEIELEINNMKILALLDIGSNVTCVQSEWLENNKDNIEILGQLPLTSVYITTATGQKSKRISKIIMIKSKIQKQIVTLQCLVIPKLMREIILGLDTIKELNMTIDFGLNKILMKIENTSQEISFDNKTKNGIERHLVRGDDDNVEWIEKEDNAIDLDILTTNLNHIDHLDESQKSKLIQLFMNYREIVSNTPGLCTEYAHEIKVKDNATFKQHSYPIPIYPILIFADDILCHSQDFDKHLKIIFERLRNANITIRFDKSLQISL